MYISYKVNSSIGCEAKANSGFVFSSWSENASSLNNNNFKTISTISDNIFGPLFKSQRDKKEEFDLNLVLLCYL